MVVHTSAMAVIRQFLHNSRLRTLAMRHPAGPSVGHLVATAHPTVTGWVRIAGMSSGAANSCSYACSGSRAYGYKQIPAKRLLQRVVATLWEPCREAAFHMLRHPLDRSCCKGIATVLLHCACLVADQQVRRACVAMVASHRGLKASRYCRDQADSLLCHMARTPS